MTSSQRDFESDWFVIITDGLNILSSATKTFYAAKLRYNYAKINFLH